MRFPVRRHTAAGQRVKGAPSSWAWVPPVVGLVARQFSGWSPASSWVGRPPVLGLVARQFLGWSPDSFWVGRPPVLGLVACQFLGWSPTRSWVVTTRSWAADPQLLESVYACFCVHGRSHSNNDSYSHNDGNQSHAAGSAGSEAVRLVVPVAGSEAVRLVHRNPLKQDTDGTARQQGRD